MPVENPRILTKNYDTPNSWTLAACGQGPMMQLNDTYHEHLTPEGLDAILDKARAQRDTRVAASFSPIGIRTRKER